jgi:hypothetical protein
VYEAPWQALAALVDIETALARSIESDPFTEPVFAGTVQPAPPLV